MRIIYLHQYFSTPKGKAGIRSYYFAKKLVDSGHEVFIICLNDSRTYCGLKGEFKNGIRKGIIEGINVFQFDIKYSNSLNFIARSYIFSRYCINSIKLAFKLRPEIIIATSTPLTVSIPAIIMRKIYGIPFIFEVRDLWPKLPIAMGILKNKIIILMLKLLEKISYKSADFIIGLAPGIVEEILNNGIPKEKVVLIPNISDINLFGSRNNNLKKPELLKKFNKKINNANLVAAFTGAHGIANGLNNLLDVAKVLKDLKRNDIKLLFIGEGSVKKRLINRAILDDLDNCIFIDSMPKKDLAIILKESVHIGLMILKNVPEFYNGTSPNKFFDYLACGIPVINNYPGWLSQMIKNKKLGFVVPPDDPEYFANKLIEIADNKKILNKISNNCSDFAKLNFTPKILSAKFSTVVNDVYLKYEDRRNNFLLKSFYQLFKSIIDRLLALILIIILSPILIIISLIVLIKLGYPIFFIQERPGLNQKIFKLIKFRSMILIKGSNLNHDDSERINSFGKFFRSTSLDELPELFNILKGEMSFVGPRPLLKEYLELYSQKQSKRHNVKPGITGLAQIKGRNMLSWEDKFNLDLSYVRQINPFLDIKILFITFWKVLKREGVNSKDSVSSKKFQGNSRGEKY